MPTALQTLLNTLRNIMVATAEAMEEVYILPAAAGIIVADPFVLSSRF
jgi:hypothetical protein